MFHQFFLSLKFVLADLKSAKWRTFLTILGIVIGIAATMIVMAVGRSAQDLVLEQVRTVGANIVAILPGAADDNGPPAAALGIVTETLTNDDLEAMRNKTAIPHLIAISGYVRTQAVIQTAQEARGTQMEGVSRDYTNVENTAVDRGRFFSSDEEARRSKVVLLGAEVATELFGDSNPLGEDVKINNNRFTIIGTFKPRGASFFSNPDTSIYVPLTTAQQILNRNYLDAVRGRVSQKEYIARTQEDMRVLLRARHNISDPANDDFSVRSLDSALTILTNITNVLTFFLVGVAAVSLIVGGIGVMNIMFIAASQRVREIGLRKSLGARSSDIFVQFVSESIILSFLGGFIGLLIGLFFAVIAWWAANAFGYAWQLIIPLDAVIIALAITFLIGVVFGSYPARRAAKISPIEALRYE